MPCALLALLLRGALFSRKVRQKRTLRELVVLANPATHEALVASPWLWGKLIPETLRTVPLLHELWPPNEVLVRDSGPTSMYLHVCLPFWSQRPFLI